MAIGDSQSHFPQPVAGIPASPLFALTDSRLGGSAVVLAPALVALLGRFNWWLPAPAAGLLRVTPLQPADPGG